jgi:hypothetical protein
MIFSLSLMNLLLSSHSGIFYPYVFLYEQASQRDSQNHINYKAISNGHGAECAAVKVQIRKRKHELAEINVRAKNEGNQRIGHALDIYAAPYIKSAASTGRILIRSAGAAPFWRDS